MSTETTASDQLTELLNRWSAGDREAFQQVVPLVYGSLKQVASHLLIDESRALTLNTTALVHEAYLRLRSQTRMQWNGRAHFFGAAAQLMRRILVEHARRRLAHKRGAGAPHKPVDNLVAVAMQPDLDVLALDCALEELAGADPESARVVELRCFSGLSIPETAEVLGISPSSVSRLWVFARAWLYRRITGG
jgi:RNA polymerase sigma factor (TIGR02999 family)